MKQTGIKHFYIEYSKKAWLPDPGAALEKIGIGTPLIHTGKGRRGIVIVFSYTAAFPVEI